MSDRPSERPRNPITDDYFQETPMNAQLVEAPLSEQLRAQAQHENPGDTGSLYTQAAEEIEKKDDLIYEAMLKYGELEQEFHKRVCLRNRTTHALCGVCAVQK